MPRLSDSMEEGTILRWLKHSGEQVGRGEELAEIETDKATMTYEADIAGVLEIVAAEGETLPIGGVMARIGAEAPAADPPPPEAPLVAADEQVAEQGTEHAAQTEAEAKAQAPADNRVPENPAPGPRPAETGTAKGDVTLVDLTRVQQVVARRMAESKATIPDFSLTTEVDMQACVALREQFQELELEATPSLNDMVVKAAALALREHPRANGSYKDGRVELHSRINVGVAVAAQDGLVVPTIFDADAKSLGSIAKETRAVAAKVREGRISSPDLSGGTFTVSNLGMYGVTEFTAVINPPQAAILAVGAMTPRPVVRAGEVVVRNIMAMTLVCDHRILYGADAAEFLARIREVLEAPAAMSL
jgi:pyruvate dehydrogenase E2 component (dihydrolipoamide acetyltransferase)